MNRRRTTVHDFSSLHLHPDGSRAHAASQHLKPRAHRDVQGNWLAEDAADFAVVPKYQKVVEKDLEKGGQGEEFDFSGIDLSHVSASSNLKGKERENTPPEPEDRRDTKRRKLAHDFRFLESHLVPETPHDERPTASTLAVPSSDLLKSIHHFACNYYSDRGQLFNASSTYRKVKKKRRLEKQARGESRQDTEEREDEDDDDSTDEEEDAPNTETEAQTPTKRILKKDRRRDMYKTMDGSALLAIGMLLQEHVAQLLAPRIPDGWEQSVLDAYAKETEDALDSSEEDSADNVEEEQDGSDPDTMDGNEEDEDEDESDDGNEGEDDGLDEGHGGDDLDDPDYIPR